MYCITGSQEVWTHIATLGLNRLSGGGASSGGMFTNYGLVQGVDTIVPVDIYVPGCPPRPEMLMYGVLKLHEKVRTEGRVK